MIDNPRIFAGVFSEIVSGVRAKYDTVNNKTPYYMYGHYLAIANELIAKTKDQVLKFEKYPLVILGIDPEYKERDIDSSSYEVDFNCYIVDRTKKEWFTSDRFEQVFKTILFPIYELLKQELIYSNLIGTNDIELQPEVKLIPYWGTETAQGSEKQWINDPLDAIKVKFSSLGVFSQNC